MRFDARIQATIDILDHYEPQLGPLDPFIKEHLKSKRYAGSKDRHFITDLTYTVIRQAPLYLEALGHSAWQQGLGRWLMVAHFFFTGQTFTEAFTGYQYAPAALSSQETQQLENWQQFTPSPAASHHLPQWLYDMLKPVCRPEDFAALNTTASFDLRVNAAKMDRDAALKQLDYNLTKTPYSPLGLRGQDKFPLTTHPLFTQGCVDVQDEGSQIIALLMEPRSNEVILDLCAGGGGKTLALAEQLGQDNALYATDYDAKRLRKATLRLQSRGFSACHHIAFADLKMPQYQQFFDKILIDAPCSGLGTLRRHPEIKLALTPEKIHHYSTLQYDLIKQAIALLKPGGTIMYATCSLAPQENHHVIDKALSDHPDIALQDLNPICYKVLSSPIPALDQQTLLLKPGTNATDGFFIALLQKRR